jgi:hypothetical protein
MNIIFAPGITKTANATLNVAPAGLSLELELWLGPDESTKVVSSGKRPFTSTGANQNINASIDMPNQGGTYEVYVDIYYGADLVLAFIGIDTITIISGTLGPIVWS